MPLRAQKPFDNPVELVRFPQWDIHEPVVDSHAVAK
jgi:hypothetical protein